ncbi:MAG: protein jag [Thermoflexales bacterium]|nr:protein jag [Thermoflexales bacterium]
MEDLQAIEAVGGTVDEAIARGLDALNLTRADVTIQILDDGSSKQAGAHPEARVLLTPTGRSPLPADVQPPSGEDEGAAASAAQTLQEMLDKMRIRGRVEPRWESSTAADEEPELRLILDIRGDDLGVLIGRQGETVESLQYLTRLIASREVERQFNLIVDVEGYKARRERQLKQLAERMAERVASTRRPVALEPMPAHERRIVHVALRDHPSVTTESVGRGGGRKVTLIPRSSRR